MIPANSRLCSSSRNIKKFQRDLRFSHSLNGFIHPSSKINIVFKEKNQVMTQLFKASALWADAFYKSICPSVCPSVCVSVCSLLRYRLFAPTSRSRMSNIFTDSQSLGKSNGKKWSQIWTFLFEYCRKLRHKKKFFFLSTFFTFFWSSSVFGLF